MKYKPLKIENVLDFEKFNKEPDALTAIIAYLEAITAPAHSDDGGHKFEDDPNENGVCKHCGWVHPDVPADCDCGKSLKQHLADPLEDLRNIRAGKMPNVLINMLTELALLNALRGALQDFEIEMIVQMSTTASPRQDRRRPF